MIQKVFRNAPPRQRNVSQECIKRRGLLAAILFPEMERLGEALRCPERVVRAIIELFSSLWMVITPVVDVGPIRSTSLRHMFDQSVTNERVWPQVKAVIAWFLNLGQR